MVGAHIESSVPTAENYLNFRNYDEENGACRL